MGAPNDANAPFSKPSTLSVKMHCAISHVRAVLNRKLIAARYILENGEL